MSGSRGSNLKTIATANAAIVDITRDLAEAAAQAGDIAMTKRLVADAEKLLSIVQTISQSVRSELSSRD